MLSFRRYLPAPQLRGHLNTYYVLDLEPQDGRPMRDTLVPELANIRIRLKGQWHVKTWDGAEPEAPPASLWGPTTRPVEVEARAPTRLFGVGLKPSGWHRFMSIGADELTDAIAPLEQGLGEGSNWLVQAVTAAPSDAMLVAVADAFFLKELRRRDEDPPVIHMLERALANPDLARVEDLADAVGLSPRQLERWCLRLHGVGPKLLLRKQRFLAALNALRNDPDADWLDAAGVDFYDQSHFIREFKRFAGMTPTEYRKRQHRLIEASERTHRELAKKGALPEFAANRLVGVLYGEAA